MINIISKKNILIFNIVVLSTAFSPFIGKNNINNLLIGVMICSILIFAKHFLNPNKKDWTLYLLPFTLLITGFLNLSFFRSSSYFYSLLFILFFLTNLHLIRYSKITIRQYQSFLKILLYSYFFILVIQQVMYVIGIENFLNKISAEGFKFNSIATEPSYASIIILMLFYTYISIKKKQNNGKYQIANLKNDRMLWFVFTYQMLTLGSSFGILFFVLFLLTFIKKISNFLMIIFLLLMFYFSGLALNFEPLIRLNSIISATLVGTLDYSNLIEADHSASVRLIPFLMAFSSFEFYKFFGMGMDFSSNYFPSIIIGIEPGAFGGGLFPSFTFDNGIINTIILMIIIKEKAIQKFFSFELLVFIIILLNTSFNSQLFWFVVTILTINKHFNTFIISSTTNNSKFLL